MIQEGLWYGRFVGEMLSSAVAGQILPAKAEFLKSILNMKTFQCWATKVTATLIKKPHDNLHTVTLPHCTADPPNLQGIIWYFYNEQVLHTALLSTPNSAIKPLIATISFTSRFIGHSWYSGTTAQSASTTKIITNTTHHLPTQLHTSNECIQNWSLREYGHSITRIEWFKKDYDMDDS